MKTNNSCVFQINIQNEPDIVLDCIIYRGKSHVELVNVVFEKGLDQKDKIKIEFKNEFIGTRDSVSLNSVKVNPINPEIINFESKLISFNKHKLDVKINFMSPIQAEVKVILNYRHV